MNGFLEEYGGTILAVLTAGTVLSLLLAGMSGEGIFYVLTERFAAMTFGA